MKMGTSGSSMVAMGAPVWMVRQNLPELSELEIQFCSRGIACIKQLFLNSNGLAYSCTNSSLYCLISRSLSLLRILPLISFRLVIFILQESRVTLYLSLNTVRYRV